MFRKRRNLLVSDVQLVTVLRVLANYDIGIARSVFTDFKIENMENCRWVKAPDCWFMTFKCRNKDWHNILIKFKEKGIIPLYPR